MMKKNEITDVEVTGITSLGYGVSKVEGKVVFIDGGVTGDRLKIKIIKDASDYYVARIEKVLFASQYRITDICDCRRCGGCIFGHISREYELELKRDFVVDAFRKKGIKPTVLPVVTDGRRERYRNKIQIPVQGNKIGYYARHSHDIVSCGKCCLAPDFFSDILKFVSEYSFENEPMLRHIYIRYAETTDEVMLCLVTSKAMFKGEERFASDVSHAFPQIKSVAINCQAEETNVILGSKTRIISGSETVTDVLCGCSFNISPNSFYQINRGVAELLYNEAIKRAAESAPRYVADLYCGAGTIGISFAKKNPGVHVLGLEIVPQAIENAKINAELNGIENVEFFCEDAASADLDGIDVCIVDPPRKGLSEKMLKKISDSKIGSLVYVSCNPETLARDTDYLIGKGFVMGTVAPFDMFPRTGSVECVTNFYRKK